MPVEKIVKVSKPLCEKKNYSVSDLLELKLFLKKSAISIWKTKIKLESESENDWGPLFAVYATKINL